ncbi:MAG: tetratricopeptide repeat protein [Deltaproteobacteria bacterium]|nr:tetratricopeptide repeat protein [Deltaproteobacteria bacterium]
MVKNTPIAQPSKSLFKKDVASLLLIFVLFITAVLLYLQHLDNPIVFDTAQSFNGPFLEGCYDSFNLFNLRSLAYVTFGIFYKWIGMDWFWHRILNLVFHATNTCLVFVFLKGLFGEVLKETKEELPVSVSWMAFLGGIFFAVDPISVYATAYLVQRSIQMATLFSLISLLFYQRAVILKQWYWFLPSVLSFFLAVHCKEHCVMLPAVAFIMTLILDPFEFKKYLERYGWVFLLFTVVAVEITLYQIGILGKVYEPHGEGMIDSANVKESVFTAENAYPLSVITQAYMFFRYLYLWIIPDVRLIYIDIQLPFATSLMSWPETFAFICFCCYPVMAFWLLRKKGTKALLGFGLLSPWLLFLTEVSVVRLSEQFVLYRSYLWMFALPSVLPFLFSIRINNHLHKKLMGILVFLYLAGLTVATVDRLDSFDTKVSIWEDAVSKIRAYGDYDALYKNYRPFNNLAFALTSTGKLIESIPYYYEAVRINPNYVKARSNLGAVLTNQGRYQEAIEHFKHAVKVNPLYIDAFVGLGVCAAEQGNQEEAIEYYQQAIKIKEDYPDANFNMGNAYLKLKDFNKAVYYYQVAIKANPSFADAHHNLGLALGNLGKFMEARATFENTLKIDPNHTRSQNALKLLNEQLLKITQMRMMQGATK